MWGALLLVVTHLMCVGIGAGLAYTTVKTGTGDPPHPHLPHIPHPHPTKDGQQMTDTRQTKGLSKGTIILVASIILLALGVQMLLAQHAAQEEQAKRDRVIVCLNDFAENLVDTLRVRTTVNGRVDKAGARRDNAVDQVILAVVGARAKPPTATEADFDRRLKEFAKAKAKLEAARIAADQTRKTQVYKTPRAVCKP